MMKFGISVFVLACLAGGASAQFVNGGFETGDFTGWTIGLTSGGANAWQQVVDFDIDGPGALGISKAAQFSVGRATGVTTGEHGVLLTQNLFLTAGVQYTFEFDWAATRVNTTSTNTQGGIFALMVGGTEINRSAAGTTGQSVPKYGHHVGTFTPGTSGNYDVGVAILRPFTIPTPTAPNLFQSVDNFGMSPVPEPATMAILGIGSLWLARRRKK